MGTPLQPIEAEQVAAFWRRFLATGAVEESESAPVPQAAEPFGDSVELADELLSLVIDGAKRATAGALIDYELEGVTVPTPGTITIATDGAGRPRAVLRTTEVYVAPLSTVSHSFAWDEGEGDRTRAGWLASHEAFFRRYLPSIGVEFDREMATVFERFEVLYTE